VKAALVAGDLVSPSGLDGLELLMVADCYPSPVTERAGFVFPAAVLAEVDGTFIDGTGEPRPQRKACRPPGESRPDWWIVSALAEAMNARGFSYVSAEEIAKEAKISEAKLRVERQEMPAAARDPRARRTHFRGHRLGAMVGGLESLGSSGDEEA
jgi:anaerobic selenocysteine-containing dehydrogenase